MTRPPAPSSTYRVQLRGEMTLDAARGLVRYLAELGVSHVYLSPVLRARAGSTHGYDVVDPNAIDPALGGEAAFERFAATAKSCRRRHPARRGAEPRGGRPGKPGVRRLAHARPGVALRGLVRRRLASRAGRSHARIVLPALGEPLEEAARNGMLHLVFERGRIRLRYRDRTFPLDPATLSGVLAGAAAALEGATETLALDAIASALRAVPPRATTDAVSRVATRETTAEASVRSHARETFAAKRRAPSCPRSRSSRTARARARAPGAAARAAGVPARLLAACAALLSTIRRFFNVD
jgi:(1->4)-alpha-D-glucan 1-alpha-D-glucosylmutase